MLVFIRFCYKNVRIILFYNFSAAAIV